MKADDPVANEHLEHLAGNDCNLAGQFRPKTNFWIRILERSQAILRHCPDLFNGCKLGLYFKEENKSSTLFLECLTELEEAKPVEIYVSQREDQVIDYWHHPTFLNCSRIDLNFWSNPPAETMKNIFDWLHQQPNGVECDASAGQQVRYMIVYYTVHNEIDWLINRCSEVCSH